jgi:hypothetical protein
LYSAACKGLMIRVDPITAAPDNTDRRVQFIVIVSIRPPRFRRPAFVGGTVVDLAPVRHENSAWRFILCDTVG